MTLAVRGVPHASPQVTPAFPGAHKWAKMLCHSCILGDPQTKGDKIGCHCVTPTFLGSQKRAEMLCQPCILPDPKTKGGQHQNGLPHPCLREGPKEGGNAMPPVHSRGCPNKGGAKSELGGSGPPSRQPKRRRRCYVTLAFSGIPKQRGTKSEWTASPLPSRGARNERKCYVNLAFSVIPKQRGTKSELAASTPPSPGPKRGRKCYANPAFSEIPKQRGDKIRIGCLNAAFSAAQNRAENAMSPLH